MKSQRKIIIELMFKANYCIISSDMDEAMREVLPYYSDYVEYRKYGKTGL